MNEQACVLAHDQRAPALDGLLLCGKHHNQLDDLTTEISNLIIDMCRILDGGAPTDPTPKTRRIKAAEAPAPVDLTLLALLDARTKIGAVHATTRGEWDRSEPLRPTLAVIASWVLMVAEERPLTAALPKSVIGQLDLLTRHHDWIAAHPAVDDYHAELTQLRRDLRDVTHDHTHHRIATCDLPSDNGKATALIIRDNRARRFVPICGGSVLVKNGETAWRCNRCHETWITDQQKARFGVKGAD